jgi:hypothetical protein
MDPYLIVGFVIGWSIMVFGICLGRWLGHRDARRRNA